MTRDWSAEQLNLCKQYKCDFVEADQNSKLGIALSTHGKLPVNGLRHPPTEATTGWYIWCGTELSEGSEFFIPLHVRHLEEKYPEVVRFLGQPPGYRFLIGGEHVDIWFDAKLLAV